MTVVNQERVFAHVRMMLARMRAVLNDPKHTGEGVVDKASMLVLVEAYEAAHEAAIGPAAGVVVRRAVLEADLRILAFADSRAQELAEELSAMESRIALEKLMKGADDGG